MSTRGNRVSPISNPKLDRGQSIKPIKPIPQEPFRWVGQLEKLGDRTNPPNPPPPHLRRHPLFYGALWMKASLLCLIMRSLYSTPIHSINTLIIYPPRLSSIPNPKWITTNTDSHGEQFSIYTTPFQIPSCSFFPFRKSCSIDGSCLHLWIYNVSRIPDARQTPRINTYKRLDRSTSLSMSTRNSSYHNAFNFVIVSLIADMAYAPEPTGFFSCPTEVRELVRIEAFRGHAQLSKQFDDNDFKKHHSITNLFNVHQELCSQDFKYITCNVETVTITIAKGDLEAYKHFCQYVLTIDSRGFKDVFGLSAHPDPVDWREDWYYGDET